MHYQNDLTKLSRTGRACKRARQVFEKIRDEIIDEFGVSEEFLRVHRANINIELLKCEMLHTGDKTLNFHIQMEEKILGDLLKPLVGSKNDLYDAMIWIKKQQISFNENEVSTFWFLKYMNHLIKNTPKPKPEPSHGRK
jgi:transcription-repair coupling factor (superfamily II helicase)